MEEINKIIGEKIKKARLNKNFSREQLARKCGIKQQTIEKYENGEINISISRII